jgi:hypothetical protein
VLNRIAYGDYGDGMSPELAFDAAMAGLELFDPVSYFSLLAQQPEDEMRSGGMTQSKYPLKATADELARRGRFGDSARLYEAIINLANNGNF